MYNVILLHAKGHVLTCGPDPSREYYQCVTQCSIGLQGGVALDHMRSLVTPLFAHPLYQAAAAHDNYQSVHNSLSSLHASGSINSNNYFLIRAILILAHVQA